MVTAVHLIEGDLPVYASRAAAAAATISDSVTSVLTAGYYDPGDGGGGPYVYVASEPSHDGKFQSANGRWFELTGSRVNIRQFGAKDDISFDSLAAIESCFAYGAAIVDVPAGVYASSDTLVVPYGTSLIGEGEQSEICFTADVKGLEYGTGASGTTTVAHLKVTTSVANANIGVHIPFGANKYVCDHVTVAFNGANTNRFTIGFECNTWIGEINSLFVWKAVTHSVRLVGSGGVSGEINAVQVDNLRVYDCSDSAGIGLYVENAEAALNISNPHFEGSLKTCMQFASSNDCIVINPYFESGQTAHTHLKISGCVGVQVQGGYWNASAETLWNVDASSATRALSLIGCPLYNAISFNDVRGVVVGGSVDRTQITSTSSRISYIGVYDTDSAGSFDVDTDLYNLSIRGGQTLVGLIYCSAVLDFGSIAAAGTGTLDVTDSALASLLGTTKCAITATPDSNSSFLEDGLIPVALPRTASIRLKLNNITAGAIDPASRTWHFEVRLYE